MKNFFLLLFFTSTFSFANDYQKVVLELSSLQQSYDKYVLALWQISSLTNTNNIKKLDQELLSQKPITTTFSFSSSNTFDFLPLDFFNEDMYQLDTMSSADKKFLAELDRAKLNTTLFMFTNLNALYISLSNKKSLSKKAYKDLFKKSELKLFSLAQEAYATASRKRTTILNTEYNLIILQLSSTPFPPEYSFYRRRMAYSIQTPEAAQHEITRLKRSMVNY